MFKDKKAAVITAILLSASLVSGCGSTIIAGTDYAEAFPTPPAGSAESASLSDEESAEAFTAMTEGTGTMADFLNETEADAGSAEEEPAEETLAVETTPTAAPTPVPQQPTPVPQQPAPVPQQPQPQQPQPQPQQPQPQPTPTPTPAKQRIWIDPVTQVIDHPEQGHYETTSVQKVKCQCGAVFNSPEEHKAHQDAWVASERIRLNDPTFECNGTHTARYFTEETQQYVVDTPAWQETVVVEEGHWEYVD